MGCHQCASRLHDPTEDLFPRLAYGFARPGLVGPTCNTAAAQRPLSAVVDSCALGSLNTRCKASRPSQLPAAATLILTIELLLTQDRLATPHRDRPQPSSSSNHSLSTGSSRAAFSCFSDQVRTMFLLMSSFRRHVTALEVPNLASVAL